MEAPPKFIADEMNGDIARWLRIIGFDCTYLTGEKLDDRLIQIAAVENRILLTSDKELFKKAIYRGIEAHYITQGELEDKLKEIVDRYKLNSYTSKLKYRCPLCNQELVYTNNTSEIPPKVRDRHKIILYCRKCGKYYWRGSHWKKINKILKNLGFTNISVKKL